MALPLTQSLSNSSDYFDNDPDYIRALQEIELPGDAPHATEGTTGANGLHEALHEIPAPSTQPTATRSQRKRPRNPEEDEADDRRSGHRVLGSIDQDPDKAQYLVSDTYGAAHFGAWGEYMTRKRAKLQIQNTEMDDDGEDVVQKSRIFQGLQIYINGYTEPSIQDLRKLILQHGGIFHAYLDRKSLVTHVLTMALTPAKIREFKHMKVVWPSWLVESAQAGVLLPWHDFIFKQDERLEDAQGKRAAQQSLFDGFATQTAQQASGPSDRKGGPIPVSLSGSSTRSNDADISDTSMAVDPPTPPRTPAKPKTTSKPTTPNSSSKRPLYSAGPGTSDQASPVPGYAEAGSNKAAERAMADPAWRAAHTSVSRDFIEGYYRNSRLHHLSAWKAELRGLVAEAQERAETGDVAGTGAVDFVADENDDTVGKVVRENMRGKAWTDGGDGGDGDVSMKGAQLLRKAKGKEKTSGSHKDKVIMHCDFDSFFVSAGLIDRPHLRGKPVVVCHSQGAQGGKSSTSEIASASYEARAYGVKSGMSLQQARKLCPNIVTIPYEFQRYKQFSLQFYTILMAHADDLQAVSVDEALIDVTSSVRRIEMEMSLSQNVGVPIDPAQEFAEAIRTQVRKATGCEVSIGIAHNIMLARLASRKAKPAGSYHLRLADVAEFIAPLHIDNLHGFGRAAHEKAQEKLGATSLRELGKMSKAVLCEALGKGTGETLYNAIRGVDNRQLESDKARKSVSCDINYGIRFESNEQAELFIYQLAEEVSRRLESVDMHGRSLTLKVMKRDPAAPVEAPKFMGHGMCESYTKQAQLVAPGGRATSDHKVIGEHAWRLLKSLSIDPKELRGLGIQIQRLEKIGEVADVEPGQAVLPFKPTDTPKKKSVELEPEAQKNIEEHPASGPPSQVSPASKPPAPIQPEPVLFDLPSFSQVDMSVFDALPDDVRKELEQEYERRSITPAIVPKPVEKRPAPIFSPRNMKAKFKLTVPGIPKKPNVKRIARQLAPRNGASLAASKSRLFKNQKQKAKFMSSPKVKVSVAELRLLGVDPSVFYMLPTDVQREQLAFLRQTHAPGGSGLAFGSQRKGIKAKKLRGKPIPKRPPPKARYRAPPSLKQRGKEKGEKLSFTEKDDVQDVIGLWVDRFKELPPNAKDVEFFAKFLVRCVDRETSGDSGIERAVAVAKWWLILLRRNFGAWEHAEEADEEDRTLDGSGADVKAPYTSEVIGRAWWKAFREVKEKMDVAARKKFGGSLSLR